MAMLDGVRKLPAILKVPRETWSQGRDGALHAQRSSAWLSAKYVQFLARRCFSHDLTDGGCGDALAWVDMPSGKSPLAVAKSGVQPS